MSNAIGSNAMLRFARILRQLPTAAKVLLSVAETGREWFLRNENSWLSGNSRHNWAHTETEHLHIGRQKPPGAPAVT
jgi:hypothetical protein